MSMIQILDLTFAYDGSSQLLFDHVSFRLDTDWRLGLTGRNGRARPPFCGCCWESWNTGEQSRQMWNLLIFPIL